MLLSACLIAARRPVQNTSEHFSKLAEHVAELKVFEKVYRNSKRDIGSES